MASTSEEKEWQHLLPSSACARDMNFIAISTAARTGSFDAHGCRGARPALGVESPAVPSAASSPVEPRGPVLWGESTCRMDRTKIVPAKKWEGAPRGVQKF